MSGQPYQPQAGDQSQSQPVSQGLLSDIIASLNQPGDTQIINQTISSGGTSTSDAAPVFAYDSVHVTGLTLSVGTEWAPFFDSGGTNRLAGKLGTVAGEINFSGDQGNSAQWRYRITWTNNSVPYTATLRATGGTTSTGAGNIQYKLNGNAAVDISKFALFTLTIPSGVNVFTIMRDTDPDSFALYGTLFDPSSAAGSSGTSGHHKVVSTEVGTSTRISSPVGLLPVTHFVDNGGVVGMDGYNAAEMVDPSEFML